MLASYPGSQLYFLPLILEEPGDEARDVAINPLYVIDPLHVHGYKHELTHFVWLYRLYILTYWILAKTLLYPQN